MLLALIIWAIVGVFVLYHLHETNYLEDLSPKTMGVVCLICGPVTWFFFILGLIVGVVQVIILLMEKVSGHDD